MMYGDILDGLHSVKEKATTYKERQAIAWAIAIVHLRGKENEYLRTYAIAPARQGGTGNAAGSGEATHLDSV